MQVEIPATLVVDVYSHFFKVKPVRPIGNRVVWQLINEFAEREYVRDDYGDNKEVVTKVYAGKTKDNREFRFHVGQWARFKQLLHLNALTLLDCKTTYHEMPPSFDMDFQTNPNFTLFDYQEDARQFALLTEEGDLNSRLIGIPTGKGKTVTLAFIMATIGKRVVLYLLPKYIDKWKSDLKELLGLEEEDIYVVEKEKSRLTKLVELSKKNAVPQKVIVFSQPMLNNFIKFYEANTPEETIDEYGCLPEELIPLLGAGLLGVDEVHENLHMLFRILLYTHVPKFVALSGTFLSEQPFTDFIQKTIFPKSVRYDKIKMEQYIHATSYGYTFRHYDENAIRTKEWGSNMYSHVAFEKSIMRRKDYLEGYLKLIDYLVGVNYYQYRQPGDKAVVYAATIKMCELIAKHLKKKYPHLDIRTYVEKDPYENVIVSDIRVTTIQSAGTAIDIPMLIYNLLTNTLFSHKSNLQILGRLRKLKDKITRFDTIYCKQIKKQVAGNQERKKLIRSKVKHLNDQDYPYPV